MKTVWKEVQDMARQLLESMQDFLNSNIAKTDEVVSRMLRNVFGSKAKAGFELFSSSKSRILVEVHVLLRCLRLGCPVRLPSWRIWWPAPCHIYPWRSGSRQGV